MAQLTVDEIQSRMGDIWTELVRVRPAPDADFFELGGGSMELIMLIGAVEQQFGAALSIDELFADTFTFDDSVRGVAQALASAPPGAVR
ncbi:acyl carrier protein [Micromonosporaceae bacterium Da 78-11]